MTGAAGRTLGLSIWSALILAGLVLLSRRFAGALTAPLPPLTLAFVAIVVSGLSLVAFTCACRPLPAHPRRRGLAAGLSWLAVFLPIASVSSSFMVMAGTTLSVLFLGLGFALNLFRETAREDRPVAPADRNPQFSVDHAEKDQDTSDLPQVHASLAGVSASINNVPAVELAIDQTTENVVQRLTRRDEEGLDVFEGTVRVDFAAGQKLAIVHLPFWPAFSCPPRMVCEGTDCRVKVAAVQVYGTRIEVKRTTDTEATQVWLEICATDDRHDRVAA
ncbi:MAG: hypothetical protein ABGZ17_08415 [Planctomycetaceae bacterium]